MLNDIVKLGDKLEIKEIYLGQKNSTKYVSRLFDIADDNTIIIAMPLDKGKVILMDLASIYEILFYSSNSLYVCKAKVIRRHKMKNGIYVAVMQLTSKIAKAQRREYYRFECVIGMKYIYFETKDIDLNKTADSKDENQLSKQKETLEIYNQFRRRKDNHLPQDYQIWSGMVTDISGGGLKFRSEHQVEKNSVIIMELKLMDYGPTLKLYGKIIDSKVSTQMHSLYEHRVKFAYISEVDRDVIIRFIFDEERKIRHKSKGY